MDYSSFLLNKPGDHNGAFYVCKEEECREILIKGREMFTQHLMDFHKISLSEANKRATKQRQDAKHARAKIKNKEKKRLNVPVYKYEYKPAKCEKCNKVYANKASLKRHFERIHEEKFKFLPQVKCLQCNKMLSSERLLKAHIETIHEGKNKILCNLCGQVLRKERLRDHMEIIHGENEIPCDQCLKTFRNENSLKAHKKYSHKQLEMCNTCGKVMVKANLEYHMMAKHSPYEMRPFMCQYCSSRFIKIKQLRQHVQSAHSEIKPYPCAHCSKVFSTQPGLYAHKKTHTDNRTFQCDHCEKSYKQATHLTRHRMEKHQLMSVNTFKKQTDFLISLATRKFMTRVDEETMDADKLTVKKEPYVIPILPKM